MNLDLEAALLTLGTTLVGLLLPSLRGEYQIRICTKDPHGRTPFSLCHLHLVDWLTVAVILTPVKPASVSVPPRQVWGCSAAGPAACGHEALSLCQPPKRAQPCARGRHGPGDGRAVEIALAHPGRPSKKPPSQPRRPKAAALALRRTTPSGRNRQQPPRLGNVRFCWTGEHLLICCSAFCNAHFVNGSRSTGLDVKRWR